MLIKFFHTVGKKFVRKSISLGILYHFNMSQGKPVYWPYLTKARRKEYTSSSGKRMISSPVPTYKRKYQALNWTRYIIKLKTALVIIHYRNMPDMFGQSSIILIFK